MSSRWSSSGVAVLLRAVRAVAWRPSDAPPWSVLRVYRPGVRPGYGPRYVRPAYRWGPGGAIAAGAALGFVAAGTAAAWAGAAPAPGYCWYYTDPSRTQGFWDVCP